MSDVFCTLFDERYLVKGLTLHRTLTERRPHARLVAFCMDHATEQMLDRLALPNLRAVPLRALEEFSPDLRAARTGRAAYEYYWTLTPATCRYVLDVVPDCESVTYVDADVMMFSDPEPVFDEMGGASVLLVSHRYPPRWQHWEEPGGTYNVQFMVFRNDSHGRAALDWWHERCVEWCFDRYEPGRFGDQKYLDDWPQRFQGVHVLEHRGGGLGPWNAGQHDIVQRYGRVTIGGEPLLFFHFSSFEMLLGSGPMRFLRALERASRQTARVPPFGWNASPLPMGWRFWPDYPVTATERALIWARYAHELAITLAGIRARMPGYSAGSAELSRDDIVRLTARTLLSRKSVARLRAPRRLLRMRSKATP